MQIPVYFTPSCTWELEGDTFYCTHDEFEVVEYTVDYMTFDGTDQYEVEGYECAECHEQLEGSPAEDKADYLASIQEDEARDCE